ncbi:hypothetical protein EHQ27_03030 [Leptospira wolffii]|nr:hypothetical protein EHQ32_01100 [Leptospira wolffii]TGK76755.1 hypothetical protein EHQ35_00115 [Leptospira wolffii]TGK77393.1 hypothetical protein EHQ27_03030 [Leptospira wolffii]TGL26788.1 hypothetical protein EHQ57_18935 [Leptospira wolffii]
MIRSSYKILILLFVASVSCGDIERPPLYTLFLTPNLPGNIGVVTTDFAGGGRFKVVNPQLLLSYPGLTPIHSDAVARFGNGMVYILNRLNRDSVQVLDPNFAFQTVAEWSMGTATNPADIAILGPNKAYVSLYGSDFLRIIDPSSGASLGALDLGVYSENSGMPDHLPEMSGMQIVGTSLFLCLQRLDRNDPVGYFPPGPWGSLLLEIDTITDTVIGTYTFPVPNPVGKPQLLDLFGESHLVFANPNRLGFISAIDGGVTAFRLSTRSFRPGYLFSEATAGGDIMGVQVVNDQLGFASVLDAGFNKTLQVFNPSTGARSATLISIPSSYDASLSSILIADDGILYVSNTQFTQPGVSMFDTNNGNLLLTPIPISVDLQPFDLIQLK